MSSTSDPFPPGLEGVRRAEALALLAAIFLVAACGLIYELLLATISSYLLGSSVTQFSISVGLFVGSMGIGSWISQRIERRLIGTFVMLEVLLAAVGGFSASILFAVYATGVHYYPTLLVFLVVIGAIVGTELPILVRILNTYGELKTVVAEALSIDYLGSLAGSILFPLLLLPALGLVRTGFVVGLINVGVATYTLRVFARRIRGLPYTVGCAVLALLLGAGALASDHIGNALEQRLYEDQIILARSSAYQRIVFTRWREDFRLFLDGNLQFASLDEHRYHEALVHPAMSIAGKPSRVLILGGGDGLAVREVLRHPEVEEVVLVDLDPAITSLAQTFPPLRELNGGVLNDRRVRIVNRDAMSFLQSGSDRFDVVIADLPDPNGEPLAKLYSREFFGLAGRRLARDGALVTQATSPFFSRRAYWCIERTVAAAGFKTLPYHAQVPSFGDWGWVLATHFDADLTQVRIPPGTRYLTPAVLRTLAVFDPDSDRLPAEVSTLDRPNVLGYYLSSAQSWQ